MKTNETIFIYIDSFKNESYGFCIYIYYDRIHKAFVAISEKGKHVFFEETQESVEALAESQCFPNANFNASFEQARYIIDASGDRCPIEEWSSPPTFRVVVDGINYYSTGETLLYGYLRDIGTDAFRDIPWGTG